MWRSPDLAIGDRPRTASTPDVRVEGDFEESKILQPTAQQLERVKCKAYKLYVKGKDEWSFVADVVFMDKEAVPKNLNRLGSQGRFLLRQDSKHFHAD